MTPTQPSRIVNPRIIARCLCEPCGGALVERWSAAANDYVVECGACGSRRYITRREADEERGALTGAVMESERE